MDKIRIDLAELYLDADLDSAAYFADYALKSGALNVDEEWTATLVLPKRLIDVIAR